MEPDGTFGGDWTIKKLDIIFSYLDAYATALKKFSFERIYVDGFAGEGVVRLRNGNIIEGSAQMALNVTHPFDRYIFIEKNKEKASRLSQMASAHPDKKIYIINEDANKALSTFIRSTKWEKSRAVFFLDPFATETEWKTLQLIAETRHSDVWFLFPFSAVNRMLTKDIEQTKLWEQRIDKCFGCTNWKESVYKKKKAVQLSLLPGSYESEYAKVNSEALIEYTKNRLSALFPFVAPNPKILKNEKGSILFVLFFMTANPEKKAIDLANRIAGHILRSKQ